MLHNVLHQSYPTLYCIVYFKYRRNGRHHEQLILFAGKGSPTQPVGQRNAIHYWSLYDNKILRKFRGHTDQITSISVCPADDSFLTSSLDRTVRLWTARQAGCLAELKLPAETIKSPLSAFDFTGLVFCIVAAVAGEPKGYYLHLYDARNFRAGAFAELKILESDLEVAIQSHVNVATDRAKQLSQDNWTSIKFNISGDKLLIGTEKGMCILLDGFTGAILRVLLVPSNIDRISVACFTPDDDTVLQGNSDGSISCWNVQTGAIIKTLTGHPGPITCIAANPKYTQIASACTQTAIWNW
jgi:COMPASS component SWD2